MVTFLQGQIDRLSSMVATMQQGRQEGPLSKEMVKEVLVEVVREVQNVDRLKLDLNQKGIIDTAGNNNQRLQGQVSQTRIITCSQLNRRSMVILGSIRNSNTRTRMQ